MTWFANKVLSLYADSPGMRTLINEVGSAIKVSLNPPTFLKTSQFINLKAEDLSALISESAFPRNLLWVEWNTDPSVLPSWTPSKSTENLQQGALIRTAQMGQVGRVDFLTATEDNIYIMPLSMLFDWRKVYRSPQDTIEVLKDEIIQVESERDINITESHLEAMLEIRRRFQFTSSPYLVLNSADNWLVNAQSFIIGLANILECCQIEDWRQSLFVEH